MATSTSSPPSPVAGSHPLALARDGRRTSPRTRPSIARGLELWKETYVVRFALAESMLRNGECVP